MPSQWMLTSGHRLNYTPSKKRSGYGYSGYGYGCGYGSSYGIAETKKKSRFVAAQGSGHRVDHRCTRGSASGGLRHVENVWSGGFAGREGRESSAPAFRLGRVSVAVRNCSSLAPASATVRPSADTITSHPHRDLPVMPTALQATTPPGSPREHAPAPPVGHPRLATAGTR
jgi:hypothetical protein